ncbi:hypothetical protein [Methylobacterium platani]|uniref:Uncharacterized protein n=2 Tax=Methylobacterium platani TaxID=427683 RepID=A0A179SK94_9HYPH|nr:hypothetical protein [Methylobacterium platani]KMO12200.1 hypothetical protein SQ03_24895 [Methylobacterium platani JCM 14648]OAS26974.1 hypothetical protein A5481_03140 [Methylobacterium platani]
MRLADSLLPRPALTNPSLLAATVSSLSHRAASRQDLWRLLTDSYTVDLDEVAAVLPRQEPEPDWLPSKR